MSSAATLRQRRWRQRQRKGAAVLPVAVPDYFALVAALVDDGWLRECESEDRLQVAAAAAAALAEYAAWKAKKA